MFDPTGTVSITLGSVVLDRPDQTGRFIAKDLAGGWAYLIGDADGDSRCRGQGACDGGLDLTLRCGFLSAAGRVPRCGRIKVIVETRDAHRMMVQLAVKDPHVVAVIAGRPLSIMTRPDARSSSQVRLAAERVASSTLRDREQAELQAGAVSPLPAYSGIPGTAALPDVSPASPTPFDWRTRLAARAPGLVITDRPRVAAMPVAGGAAAGMRGFFLPILNGARQTLAGAGIIAPRPAPRSRPMAAWLTDLDAHVSMVTGDLQNVGM